MQVEDSVEQEPHNGGENSSLGRMGVKPRTSATFADWPPGVLSALAESGGDVNIIGGIARIV